MHALKITFEYCATCRILKTITFEIDFTSTRSSHSKGTWLKLLERGESTGCFHIIKLITFWCGQRLTWGPAYDSCTKQGFSLVGLAATNFLVVPFAAKSKTIRKSSWRQLWINLNSVAEPMFTSMAGYSHDLLDILTNLLVLTVDNLVTTLSKIIRLLVRSLNIVDSKFLH